MLCQPMQSTFWPSAETIGALLIFPFLLRHIYRLDTLSFRNDTKNSFPSGWNDCNITDNVMYVLYVA